MRSNKLKKRMKKKIKIITHSEVVSIDAVRH